MELKAAPHGTAIVRLPDQLTAASVAALATTMRAAFAGPDRLVLLRGADHATFCTGLALAGDGPVDTETFSALLASLVDAPKPTLAFVDGRAIGGGLGLASACDWVVATDRATFALPELLWGLIPAMIWPVVAARMTDGVVRRWTVSATSRSAADALAAGLVDEIAPNGREEAALGRATRMLLRLEPSALRRMRRWTREAAAGPLATALARGAALTGEMADTPTVKARLDAFRRGDAPWQ